MSNSIIKIKGDAKAPLVEVTVVTDGLSEIYAIDPQRIPSKEMALVKDSRRQIMQTINMQKMFDNLNLCVDLLDISYNAVNGVKDISPAVASLQSDFLNVLMDSVWVMQGFETGTKTTVNDLITAYGYLIKPLYVKLPLEKNGVVMACAVFESVKNKAAIMRKASEDIAIRYAKVRDKTSAANVKIMKERDADYDLQKQKESEMSQLEAQLEGYEAIKEDLDDEISTYTSEYNKLSSKIETQEKRAYNLALTAAVLGGVSGIVGSIIPSGNKSEGTGGMGGSGLGGTSSESETNKEANERYAKSEKEVNELKSKIEQNKKELAEIKEKLSKLGDDAPEKRTELLAKQDETEREKKKNEDALTSASSKMEIYNQAAGGIAGGLQVTADKLDEMSKKADDGLEAMYNRLDKIAEQKAKAAKERREATLKLATLTKSIAHATVEQRDLETVLNALITAVGCMRLVEVYLADITLFWKNVESFCGRLVDEISNINKHASIIIGIEDYTEFFLDEDFIRLYLLNILNWVALNSISTEYLNAFNNAFEKHGKLMNAPHLRREEHWKLAQKLALSVVHAFDEQINEVT